MSLETHDVKPYYMTHKGCNYVLVDTPGFDDSMLSERQVYRQIAQWLESHYRAGQQSNGLIYLLPIHGTRQKGSEVRSHNLFKRLCGRQEPGSIVLGLTFCDVEVRENIDRRKDELINHWWADMITRDCVVEVPLDVPGCLKLIEHFAPELKMTLQVQSDVVDQGKAIIKRRRLRVCSLLQRSNKKQPSVSQACGRLSGSANRRRRVRSASKEPTRSVRLNGQDKRSRKLESSWNYRVREIGQKWRRNGLNSARKRGKINSSRAGRWRKSWRRCSLKSRLLRV